MDQIAAEPRHFWRRVFALFVDVLVASVIAGALIIVPKTLFPEKIALSDGPLKFSVCSDVTSFPASVEQLIAGRDVDEARFCRYRPSLIFPAQYRVTIKVVEPTEPGSRIKRFTEYAFNATEDGKLIQPVHFDAPIRDLVLMLGSAVLLARGRRSPGKRLLGIQVSGQGCAMCRELRRIGPFLLLSLLGLAVEILNQTLTTAITIPIAVIVAGLAVLLVAFIAYYVWPMIKWRGAMPYDRATGFSVQRS